MKYCTPEQAGISSAHVAAFVKRLEGYNLSTHSILMARGKDIFFECYYAPFHKDFKHRMYSVSKSFVSVAVGFCEQEGLLSLDDPMLKYFPAYAGEGAPNATRQRKPRLQRRFLLSQRLSAPPDCPILWLLWSFDWQLVRNYPDRHQSAVSPVLP